MSRWTGLLCMVLLLLAVGVAAQGETPDYGQYRLLAVQELDLPAAAADTAAHLAPDGTQFAQFEGGEVCIYLLQGNAWAENRCFELDRSEFGGNPEDVNWSSDGRYLTAPLFRRAMVFQEETDIQVLDAESGGVIKLTDDGLSGGLMPGGDIGVSLDVAASWLDDDTLLFIRYALDPGDANSIVKPVSVAIYSVDVADDGAVPEAELVLGFPQSGNRLTYRLAADAVNGRIAVNLDEDGEGATGYISTIWQSGPEGEPFERLASLGTLPIWYLDYSANGQWLMVIQTDQSQPAAATISLVDTTSGEVVTPDLSSGEFVEPRLMIAGWSPVGDALAYVVRDEGNPSASGLYIAPGPGEQGHLVLPGEFYGTTCCFGNAIRWAANDVIMIGRGAQPGVLLVQVG